MFQEKEKQEPKPRLQEEKKQKQRQKEGQEEEQKQRKKTKSQQRAPSQPLPEQGPFWEIQSTQEPHVCYLCTINEIYIEFTFNFYYISLQNSQGTVFGIIISNV